MNPPLLRTSVLLGCLAALCPVAALADSSADVALDHVAALHPAAVLEAPEPVELTVRRLHTWGAGTHVRLAQSWRGLPILDREVIVSLDLDDRVTDVHGEPAHIPFLPPATVSEQAARAAAGRFADELGRGEMWPARTSSAIRLGADGLPRLVWVVDLSTAAPPATWRILVDAHAGGVVDFRPTSRTAVGRIYPENPITSDLTDVDLGDIDALRNEYATVVSCDTYEINQWGSGTCTAVSEHAVPNDDGDFIYSSDPTSSEDPLAEVQMYYHLDRLSRWFEDVLGFRHEGFGGLGIAIEGVVNFPYNNAFYGDVDGDNIAEVAFGQTATFDYAYDGDVIIHEFGHSVFGQIVSSTGFFGADEYGLVWAPGALNEGTADVFTMIRHPDPIVGEYAGAGRGGIRDLDEDRRCPTDLYGESHRDGETWGAFLWNVIDDDRTEPDDVARVLYGALGSWPSDVDWGFAGDSMVEAAQALVDAGVLAPGVLDAVVEHGAESGVVGCGRVVSLDEGEEPTQLLFHSRLAGDDGGIPLAQQFSIEAPENADRLRFRVKEFVGGPAALEFNVYMRRGEYVHHDVVDIPTQFGTISMPIPEDFDEAFEGEDDDFEIDLRLDSDPPLEPGATYYFAIGSRAAGSIQGFFVNAEITVDADVWLGDPPAGDDDDDDGGEGCSDCESSIAPGQGGFGLALALLLVPALRRRRG